ncbi:PDZ and LIM domain protein Zasp isoform X6 [Glossina fuscipes]|uniref:PDZ and LIM domain protein Zasp isoform X6 n=1 Tax=Glossina fuscipes TaxID=7396 RepID=A0A9C5ZLX9_9MUSC|nr:PDZ and LIM domain protein Zasp isoform X6 [Glossina fuscipes]
MSQPQLLQIKLSRFDAQPWGFRLQGGVDFASPLLVQKVNGGSLAEQAGLMPGDSVVKINDVDVFNLRHKEAQDVVVRSGNNFVMTVQRGGSTWRPQITPTGQLPQPNSPYLQTVTKTSLAHKQLESQHVGCGYNNAAKPFTQGVDGSVKSIVNKQYNSPVGIYSDESIAETLSAQAEVLAGGVLGVNFKKNEKEYHAEKSEVLKLLREEESGKSTPVTCVETAASSTSNFYWTHSHAIGGNERRYTSVSQKQHDERTGTKLQHQTLAPAATHRPNLSATMATQTGNKFKPIDEHQSGGSEAAITTDNDFATASASQPDPRLIVMPVCPALQTPEYKAELEAAAAAAAQDGSPRPLSAGGHPACQMCGVGIVGVFVRIKDKNLHVECFKCATCGTSLKNQGYYNFNNKLYCDIHAKLAALQNPPAGTEGYVPVPIKPNTKLSASTISSALSAHGYNGVANGNSGTPTPSSVVAPNASTSIIVSSSQVDKVRDSVNSNCNSNCTTVTNATNEMFPTMATMPSNITSADNGDKPFEYVTLTGNVIRSVVPPGKGSNVNYKVSQGYVRPFGAIPATTTPRSSVIYPPQPQQWSASAPPPTQSKPISNPYATLPRSNVGQQEEPSEQSLHPQHAETYFEDDYEVEQANKQSRGPLVWPPPEDENRRTPTATPLYIAPPGTQHIAVKPLEEKPVEKLELSITTGKHLSSCSENQESTKCHWQSRSAPQLTNAVQHTECESGSDSYTSTSTTTTTTSEEYQRMYAAQVHAYQMQQLYEQSGSDFDYHMDMEVAAMQQRQQEHHEHFNLTSAEYLSGRRSTQECAETLAPSLNTFKLVDMVREVTPSPVPQSNNQASRHVAFVDKPEVKEVDLIPEQLSEVQQMSIRSHASSNLTQEQKSSYSSTYESATAKTVSSKIDTQEIIQETAEDLEHSEVIFPPPSPLSHMKQKATLSGLHRPETLPKYQRNWTVLPTQSPVRTPEPSELRENVPLAFVDTPKTPRVADGVESNAVHKPVAKLCAQTSASSTVAQSSITSASTVSNYQQRVSEQRQQQSATLANSNACTQHTVPTTVPIIIEDRSGPVTMAFQSIDEHMIRDESQTPSRPYTPSSFTNKPAPIIPPYQTPEKLCFDECAPTHGKLYDRCSVSPLPDRARSPAPGPPPNPLAAIRAPRLKDDEMASVSQRMLQAGSITTGQSYLGAQQAKQQGQLLAHTETSSQSAMQSYMEKPEKHDQLKVGNVVVQKTEKESRLEEQKQSQLESHTKTQMGNVQIERRRKVTEEFEHTSSAKTTEIRTGSQNASSERRQSYGKTGYVANQAKRLSGLEEEISNLSSQSQAISARAANLTETKFPEVHGEGGAALFPSKPMVPSYSESKTASYVVSGAPDIKMVSSFAGKTMQPQEHLSNVHEASVVSAKQQQQKSLSAYSSNISSSVASCSQQQQQRQANAVSCSLTKASATNQAYATSIATNQYTSTTSQNVCPTMGALCGSRDTCCKSQQPVQTPSVNNYNNNYRPNASAGLTDFEPPQTRATSFAAPQSVMQTPLTAPAPTTTAVPTSTNYNIGSNVADGSSGGMASKGGAYGATSAPKRGRGIINKAVGPGVRVPLCNSCNTQIRGPFITALGRIWCPEHFICVNANCRRALQDIGFVEEKGDLYCEYCFEKYLAPTCSKCGNKIKGDCLNAIGKHFHPECFNCAHCGKLFGNTPFFLEDGNPYCEADWNELFTTKCFACGFPVEAGDRWVEALNHNYHSQCFNCTYCKQNLEGQSFYNKGGRPFCKNHAR